MEKTYGSKEQVVLPKVSSSLNFAISDLWGAKRYLEQGLVVKAYKEIERAMNTLVEARDGR